MIYLMSHELCLMSHLMSYVILSPYNLMALVYVVNTKVTRTGTEAFFKSRSFFYSTVVMNYDTYLEIDQDPDSEFPFLSIVTPIETAS